MRVLHLTLKKKWFDMVASGEKKEEYREIKKYWVRRLCNSHKGSIGGDLMDKHKVVSFTFKKFDAILFKNGYSKNSPSVSVSCLGIEVGPGREKWGGGYKDVFVIKLGEIIQPNSTPQ